MINLFVANTIREVLNTHSGGMKMVSLITELYMKLREHDEEKLEVCVLFDTLEAMEDVKVLKYEWCGKVKEFVYLEA